MPQCPEGPGDPDLLDRTWRFFMSRLTSRRYTDDFKSQVVALGESNGPAVAARHLDISVKSLTN